MELYDNPAMASGALDVGGASLAWSVHGNGPVAAVGLHGGPGGGRVRGLPRRFDPSRYRLLNFDQRGCGESTPHAGDWDTAIDGITTDAMVADIEAFRVHFGVERWVVWGGSWGGTLALAYAVRHPERVAGMVLVSPTLLRPSDVAWFTEGARRFLPEAWSRFAAAVPPAANLAAAYDAVVNGHPDLEARRNAVTQWLAWEAALVAHEGPSGEMPERDAIAFVRLVTRVFANAAWRGEDELLAGVRRLAGIPCTVVHGRLDLSGPPQMAFQLADAWPGCELHVVPEGHRGGPLMEARMRDAIERLETA